jgi:CxxC motif-containing protein (DUF1111 family)
MGRAIRHWPVIITLFACARASGDGSASAPGAPLSGLSAAELELFTAGRTLFDREFTPEQGLGPAFNERRCSSCHDVPTLGGMGAETVVRATRFENGRCDLLREHGGDLLQQSITDTLRALGFLPERIPATATASVAMVAPPLFGAGLIEAIPENAISRRADPHDNDRDGISGRAGRNSDGRFGRFGRKANFATLDEFIANALLAEMGLTSPAHPEEENLGGQSLPPGVDAAPDPELHADSVALITRFVRLLAAPAPEAPASAAALDSVRRGARYFDQVGCARCHTPAFRTASNVPALHNREVRLYSDLLLHDMGPERASVCAPDASPSEWRTPPLMGLRHRHVFLHDGRTQNVRSAIDAHGGEAAGVVAAFRRLLPEQQDLLVRFLYSL